MPSVFGNARVLILPVQAIRLTDVYGGRYYFAVRQFVNSINPAGIPSAFVISGWQYSLSSKIGFSLPNTNLLTGSFVGNDMYLWSQYPLPSDSGSSTTFTTFARDGFGLTGHAQFGLCMTSSRAIPISQTPQLQLLYIASSTATQLVYPKFANLSSMSYLPTILVTYPNQIQIAFSVLFMTGVSGHPSSMWEHVAIVLAASLATLLLIVSGIAIVALIRRSSSSAGYDPIR